MALQRATTILVAALIGAIIGYFVGREHLKYEIRTGFQASVDQFKKTLAAPVSKLPHAQSTGSSEAPPAPKPEEAQPLRVSLLKKGFHQASPRNGDYEDAITFTVSFTNLTSNDIRAFDGISVFTDLLDNEIYSAKLAINHPIATSATLKWDGHRAGS